MEIKYRRGSVKKYRDQFWVVSADTNSEPPISPWQLSLLHDETIVPPPGKDGRDGANGKDGRDGVSPQPAKDGERGADGKSITWRGLFNRRAEYKPQDAVSFDGSSWIAVADSQGREPSDTSRYWQVLAAKGSAGRAGRDGIGQRGPGSARLNLLQEQVDELTATGTGGSVPIAAIFDSSALAGMAIYIPSDGHADLANNNNENQTAVGICFADVLTGAAGQFVTEGKIERDDWTAVAGSIDLVPSATYYLGTGGSITSTPPNTDGLLVQPIGFALSKRMLSVEISTEPILL